MIIKSKLVKAYPIHLSLEPDGYYNAYPTWMKKDRDEVRVEFVPLVAGKIPFDQINEFFDKSYRTLNAVYHYDIPVLMQAQYMAKHVDVILSMEQFIKDYRQL